MASEKTCSQVSWLVVTAVLKEPWIVKEEVIRVRRGG